MHPAAWTVLVLATAALPWAARAAIPDGSRRVWVGPRAQTDCVQRGTGSADAADAVRVCVDTAQQVLIGRASVWLNQSGATMVGTAHGTIAMIVAGDTVVLGDVALPTGTAPVPGSVVLAGRPAAPGAQLGFWSVRSEATAFLRGATRSATLLDVWSPELQLGGSAVVTDVQWIVLTEDGRVVVGDASRAAVRDASLTGQTIVAESIVTVRSRADAYGAELALGASGLLVEMIGGNYTFGAFPLSAYTYQRLDPGSCVTVGYSPVADLLAAYLGEVLSFVVPVCAFGPGSALPQVAVSGYASEGCLGAAAQTTVTLGAALAVDADLLLRLSCSVVF